MRISLVTHGLDACHVFEWVVDMSTCSHLQHAATHCNSLQNTTTCSNRKMSTCTQLQHTVTHCNTRECVIVTHMNLTGTCAHCDTLNILQHTATHCNTLQHAATRCNRDMSTFARACRATTRELRTKLRLEDTETNRTLQAFNHSVAVCCIVLQCSVACCSVLQCIAVCCSVL